MCIGRDVTVDVDAKGSRPVARVALDDRFGKSTVVTLGPRQTCSRTVDSLVYFANGMLDEWNPYEGLHQHTVAYASTRTLNVTIDAVAFSGAISRARRVSTSSGQS